MREIQRANRRLSHWGRHGKTLEDRVRWAVNRAYRTIAGRRYYGKGRGE